MFIDFFYALRGQGIPVTPVEFMDLLAVLKYKSRSGDPVTSGELYSLGRVSLVKDIRFFDAYDLAFARTFSHVLTDGSDFRKLLEQWLEAAAGKSPPGENLKKKAPRFAPEDLLRELAERLKEQKKRHAGGNRWVGTGGVSPFGNSGFNPGGIRIGGSSQGRSGLMVAGRRQYRDYRTDSGFGIRQMKLCLKKLRLFRKEGKKELSVPATIEETCQQGGEISPVMVSPRRNQLRVLLLCDVGGSMTPHSEKVTKLFSACHQVNHFKEFKAYYFHNIIYDYVYPDSAMEDGIRVSQLMKKFDRDTRVIVLGDAAMAPYELFSMQGSLLNFYERPELLLSSLEDDLIPHKGPSGMDRLEKLREFYPYMIWLNPDPGDYWEGVTTVKAIKDLIPMYHLSVDGLSAAIKKLLSRS